MKNNVNFRKWRWGCLAVTILSGFYLLYTRFRGWFWLQTNKMDSASIGIIGGADGPTAIFVTGRFNPQPLKLLAYILSVLGIVGFILLSKRKKT